MNLKKLLEGLVAQVNPLDKGKTYKSVMAPKRVPGRSVGVGDVQRPANSVGAPYMQAPPWDRTNIMGGIMSQPIKPQRPQFRMQPPSTPDWIGPTLQDQLRDNWGFRSKPMPMPRVWTPQVNGSSYMYHQQDNDRHII